jgi:hypothetical protein
VLSTDQIEAQRECLTVCGGNSADLRRVKKETLASRGRDTAREVTDSLINLQSRRRTTMKRSLIAVILATLATAAFAEPTLQGDENRVQNAPEATTYIADTRAMGEVVHSLHP